jgi:hypothetical protein
MQNSHAAGVKQVSPAQRAGYQDAKRPPAPNDSSPVRARPIPNTHLFRPFQGFYFFEIHTTQAVGLG